MRSWLKPPPSADNGRVKDRTGNEHHLHRATGHGVRRRGRGRAALRDGQAREAGGRRSRRPQRRDDDPRDGRRAHGIAPRCGLLSADGRRRGADVRRREDPRRLLQARGTRHGARDADRAHDRPPDPAALAEGLQERGAGHLHRAVGRHGRAARHPRDQRRLGGARDLAAPVPRAGRRGAHRPDRGRAGRQPDVPADGGGVPRPRRRRDARRADDDRGGRRPGAGGDDARGIRRSRTPRSSASATRSTSWPARSASRSGSTSS